MTDTAGSMKPMDPTRLARLLRASRWACLGTQSADGPYVSWVAYACEPDFSALILHLSRLAKHTRLLAAEPRVSIALSEADSGEGDPQQLARLTLQGQIVEVARQAPDYARLKALYLERLPDAEGLFQFADFSLYRFLPQTGRWVEGFASSHAVSAEKLMAASGY